MEKNARYILEKNFTLKQEYRIIKTYGGVIGFDSSIEV